jgi:hypothetical protein
MQLKKIVIVLGLVLAANNNAMAASFGVDAYELPASGASAFGDSSSASSSEATAVGMGATAGTISFTGGPVLMISPTYSYNAQTATGAMAIAWGTGDTAYGTSAIVVSQPVLGTYTPSTAVGMGATVWANDSVAIGSFAAVGTFAPGTAPLADISMTGGTALGSDSRVMGNNSTAIGAGAQALAVNSVAIGAGSVVSTDNTVSVGNIGATRRIENVSDGAASQDAATWGQVQTLVAASGGIDTTARTMATVADSKATTALNRIDKVEVGVAASMSMAAANANAVQAASRSEKGRAIGIGAAVFAGRSMTALSYASHFNFGTITAAASLSASPSVQVGAGFAF